MDSKPNPGVDTEQYAAPNVHSVLYEYAFLTGAADPHTQAQRDSAGTIWCLFLPGGKLTDSP